MEHGHTPICLFGKYKFYIYFHETQCGTNDFKESKNTEQQYIYNHIVVNKYFNLAKTFKKSNPIYKINLFSKV